MARNIKDGFFIENAIIQTSVDNLKISLQSLSDSLLVELNSSQKVIVFEFHFSFVMKDLFSSIFFYFWAIDFYKSCSLSLNFLFF